ncbi:hypothetical protein B0O79_3576 [Flavobacteriaceae bacterium MAR_2009_75]|nr:hypothetical protein B0O79_3576 [Flavobacteriaceae bacterium MAR_2009_75]
MVTKVMIMERIQKKNRHNQRGHNGSIEASYNKNTYFLAVPKNFGLMTNMAQIQFWLLAAASSVMPFN